MPFIRTPPAAGRTRAPGRAHVGIGQEDFQSVLLGLPVGGVPLGEDGEVDFVGVELRTVDADEAADAAHPHPAAAALARTGGDTDWTRDFEYTDWDDLRAFAHSFQERRER